MQNIFSDSQVGNLIIIIIGVIIAQLIIIVFRDASEKVATKYDKDRKKVRFSGVILLVFLSGFLIYWFRREISIAFDTGIDDVFIVSIIVFLIGVGLIYLKFR